MKESLSRNDKAALSDVRAKSALSFLEDAIYTHKGGKYRTAVNRSYYSVLHMAKALLILKGISPSTHEGTRTMLALHFIKDRILSKNLLEIFKELLDRRTDVDYGDFIRVDRKKSTDSIKKAKRFITMAEKVRERLIRELKESL
jgi:uncharacterized protein (UPF0332 family)